MSQPHQLRCYEYVNKPYGVVREVLSTDAIGIFQRATSGAAHRANAVAANLRVELGAIEVGADVKIDIVGIDDEVGGPDGRTPVTRIRLTWKAARAAALFPAMAAELSIYPLSSGETQLDLRGEYRPPFGVVGSAADALVGHRVAEASVHRFLCDVAAMLKAGSYPTPP